MRRGSRAAFSASASVSVAAPLLPQWLSAVRQQQQQARRQQCPHALAVAALLLRLQLRLRGKLRRCRHQPHCYVCIDEESARKGTSTLYLIHLKCTLTHTHTPTQQRSGTHTERDAHTHELALELS